MRHAEASRQGSGHHGHEGRHRFQKPRRGGGTAAVVGNLQDIGAQVGARGQQGFLPRLLQVAGKEQATAPPGKSDHQRSVVCRERRPLPGRPEGLHRELAQPQDRIPTTAFRQRQPAAPGDAAQLQEGRIPPAAPRKPQARHRQRLEHGCQAAAMIEIRMARHHQVQPPDAQRPQCRHHGARSLVQATGKSRPSIHEDRRTGHLDQCGIPLAHVQEHHAGRGRAHRDRREPARRPAGQRRQ